MLIHGFQLRIAETYPTRFDSMTKGLLINRAEDDFSSLTMPDHKDYRKDNIAVCLIALPFVTGGVRVHGDGEMTCLWVRRQNMGIGKELVRKAIEKGATWLTCYDDGLLKRFYERLGFVEESRSANWTAGQPDVLCMRLQRD